VLGGVVEEEGPGWIRDFSTHHAGVNFVPDGLVWASPPSL